MQENSKYHSVQALINLPPLRPLKPQQQSIFIKNEPNDAQQKHVNLQIKSTRDSLIDKIEKQLWVFSDTNYDFKFPSSKFPDVQPGYQNNISYQQKNVQEGQDTFEARLNSSQIQQIKQNGEFQVKSKNEKASIPYVWKINQCLFKGRLNRINIWEDGLACCYTLLNDAFHYFLEYVPKSFKKLAFLPVNFFALIFGRKKLTKVYSPNVEEQVYKDFWENIMNNQLKNIKQQIGHSLLQKIYIQYGPELYRLEHGDTELQRKKVQTKIQKYNQQKTKINSFKNRISEIQSNFQANWVKIRKNVLLKVSSDLDEPAQKSMILIEAQDIPLKNQANTKKDQSILQKFIQQKYLIYTAHLKQNLPKQKLENNVVEAILTLVTLFSLIQGKLRLKNDKLSQISAKTRSQIQQKYSIRGRNQRFRQSTFNQMYQPIKAQVQTQFFNDLLSDGNIGNFFNQKYKSIYQKYVDFIKNFENLVKQKKKSLVTLYRPERVFTSSYILFPPYELLKTNGYYYLKKQETVTTDTSTHFWKCCLYAMRLKSWSLNCLKTMIGISWASPLGFRCLFGIDDFAYDQQISDQRLGTKRDIYRTPLLGVFRKVLLGIYQSRDAFQALPDRGIFGKNCSRICNLLQCYVFRLFFVGIIGVLMLYPVAIIILSTLSFIIGITFWIWVPLVMVLVYLFNILVFQFQIGYNNAQCIIKSFPLISLVILLLFHIMRIIGLTLYLIFISPLICFFYFIILIFQRVLRTISDTIMACFISCCGRTPSSDSAIAKKISGPGMSRDYFYSIAQSDVYILVQSELQKTFMNKFTQLTRNKISQNTQKYKNICSFVFKPFGFNNPNIQYGKDIVNNNNNQLLQSFNKKVENYMRRYPKNPSNIRFTQQQIEIYFQNSTKIVKNFVEKQKIKDWIFDQNNVIIQDYDQLTRHIWQRIFNCGAQIFQPLQKIDSRFKLVDDTNTNSSIMKQRVGSIVKVLEGEVELSHKKVTFSQAKRSLLDKDIDFRYIKQICQFHHRNNGLSIFVDRNNPCTLLIPHRNIKQLKKYNSLYFQSLKKREDKIIQV